MTELFCTLICVFLLMIARFAVQYLVLFDSTRVTCFPVAISPLYNVHNLDIFDEYD